MCHKSIEIEAVFTKIEMKNEWNVNFSEYKVCQNVPKISIPFSLAQSVERSARNHKVPSSILAFANSAYE